MPHSDCGVGLQETRKYLSLSGYGCRNLGQLLLVRPSRMSGLDRLSVPRNPLHGAGGLEAPPGRVEQHQLAHPRVVVMAADHGDDLGRMPRNRPGVEERIGPVRVAAQVLHLLGAVRIHVEQQPRVGVRRVGVLPAAVQHAAVVQHRRAPVVFLVEAQLADVLAVGVHAVQDGDVRAAVHARHADEAGRGGEQDPAVGQIAGVVAVHVRLLAGQLPQPRAVGLDLEHLPAVVVAGHGEQQLAGRRSADPRRPRTGRRPA